MIKVIKVPKPIIPQEPQLLKVFDDMMAKTLPINTWASRQKQLLKGKKF